MTEPILRLLTRLSEVGSDAVLPGQLAAFYRGPILDRMLARRVLIEQAPLTQWEVCDRCECGIAARRVRASADAFRAECPLDQRQDVLLSKDDVTSYRIGADALVAELASAGGFSRSPARIAKGLWVLGSMVSGTQVVLAFSAEMLGHTSFQATLNLVIERNETVFLCPELPLEVSMRLRGAGLNIVQTQLALKQVDGLTRLDVASFVPITYNTLTVSEAAGEVIWQGKRVRLSHQTLLVFLRLLSSYQANEAYCTNQFLEGSTQREARDLIREIRAAFTKAGFSKETSVELIKSNRSRGYRLMIDGSKIVFVD